MWHIYTKTITLSHYMCIAHDCCEEIKRVELVAKGPAWILCMLQVVVRAVEMPDSVATCLGSITRKRLIDCLFFA
jgi:hypothetical protein